MEGARGVPFGVAHHALVIEQGTELRDRDRQVGPEHVFPEILVECDPGRAAQESLSAEMSGRMPGVLVFFGISDQFAEERRKNAPAIGFDEIRDAPGQERDRVGGFPEAAVDLFEDFGGQVFGFEPVGQQDDRNGPVALPNHLDERFGIHFLGALFRDVPVGDHASEVGARQENLKRVLIRIGRDDAALLRLFEFGGQLAQAERIVVLHAELS